jgi:hypothetical protein
MNKMSYPRTPLAHVSAVRHRTGRRLRSVAVAMLLSCGFALAQQGPIPGTPRPDTPQQGGGGGGGVGIGINIDLGSVFNAIKNATKKDTQNKDDQTKPPVLQKKAVTVSSGASGSYSIDWVVQYANNTGATLPKVTVTDGPIATIINPSLVPGLVPQQGWTGTTNANAPADNFALFSGTNVAPHGVMTATFPTPAPKSMSFSGGGDGYQPIPYTRAATPAGPRIYVMNHHQLPGGIVFKCFDVTIGTDCAGWSGGKALPLGNNSGKSSGTITNNNDYLISNGKLYYAAMAAAPSDGLGIGCYDLENDTECGYTKMDNRGPGVFINGPWQIGNELYVASYDGLLYCAKFTPGMPACQGSSYQISATTIKLNIEKGFSDNSFQGFARLAGKAIGSKLYLTSLKSGSKHTNCYDTITKNACWATTLPTKGTGVSSHVQGRGNYTNYIYYSTSLTPLALCSQIDLPTAGQYCVDLTSGANFAASPLAWAGLTPLAGLEIYNAGKTYFINFYDLPTTSAYCWNWATASSCTSAPNGKIALSPSGATENYGTNIDDTGCVWVYGNKGVLWNFDPSKIDASTGLAQACGSASGKGQITFQPLQYCSGPKPFHWTSVEVKGAALVNYDKFIVKVLDSNNNSALFTKDLKASGQLQTSITGIDAQTLSKPLKIEVEYTPKPGMGGSDKPYLEVRYNAPPIEFCFKSTHTCEQSKITNIVETPDPAKQGAYISVKVDVDKPQNCVIAPPPICGQPGQAPCPTCGTPTTPACTLCGQPGQPACDDTKCGQPGQAKCRDPFCIPGTLGCPIIGIGSGCLPGDPLCGTGRPPPKPICLTGDCGVEKSQQSTAQEYKEPKVACVRKVKPAEQPKPIAAPKPRPKPTVAATPPAPVDPNAPPKPKPKPRPKPAAKPAAADDDCE